MFAAFASTRRLGAVAAIGSAIALEGSYAYGRSGGRSALAICAPAEEPKTPGEPKQPEEDDDEEEGLERYLGYAATLARLKVVLLKAKITLGAKAALAAKAAGAKAAGAKAAAAEGARYVAYSSDVGESMRPVLKPWMVNATYGVAIGYIIYDVGSDVRRKQLAGHPNDVLLATGCYKAVFHGCVSLALPAVIIHTAVDQSKKLFSLEAFSGLPRVVKWGPSALGLGLIPLMPLLDPPAERVLEAVFDRVWPVWRVGEPEHHHGHGAKPKGD